MRHNSPRAIIIGAGVAGPALALFLRRAGVSSAIYEAHPGGEGVGGALNVAPNGMNVLDALGLADAVEARGSVGLELCFRNHRGRVLARFGNGAGRFGRPSVSLMRHDLHAVLAEEMCRQDLPIHYGKRLVGVEGAESPDGVVAHFADGTRARGDVLVGADGIHSRTRSTVFPDAPAPAYVGIIGVGGRVPASAVPQVTTRDRRTLNFTFGARGFFGYIGVGGKDVVWWSNLVRERELTREELNDLSADSVRREILSIYRGYHPPIEALIEHTGPPGKINVFDIRSLPTWRKGRVVLIGDAAHAVSPNAGQGASMALEDAACLAKLLRDTAFDHASAFARFERCRKPRVERIVAEGRRRAADKQAVSPFRSMLRNGILSLVLRLTGERSQDWLYRYRIEWDRG